ncbi:MAG: tetratricopeptide repeat protein [Burkholderiaceae bacterium]|nr:tetratricopeptide repeat protein [Burkholderiaceae bacterium]
MEIDRVLAIFAQQRYNEAEVLTQTILALHPLYGMGWMLLGMIHKKQGRHAEAMAAQTRAADLLPGDAEVQYNVGNTCLQQGRAGQAEQYYRRALDANPGYLQARYNLGLALQEQARFAEAETSYRALLASRPDFAPALLNLGVVLSKQERAEEAEANFRHALALDPGNAQAHYNLANVLLAAKRHKEAEDAYASATAIEPGMVEAHFGLGKARHEQEKHAEAEAAYRRVTELKPDYTEAYFGLGDSLMAQKRAPDAEVCYRQALYLNPEFVEAYSHLGVSLKKQDRFAEAESSFRQALALRPDYASAHNNLGNALQDQERVAEAEACYREAIKYKSDYPEAYSNLGNTLKSEGRLEEAQEALEHAIALKPDFVEPHFGLSVLKTYTDVDPHLAMLEKQRLQLDGLPIESRIRYWFALGKAYEDVERFDESFAAYEQGNRLKHGTLAWNEADDDAVLEQMKAVFSSEFFAGHRKLSHAGKAPIFIVGMPRSGTTLLEQILSTHPGGVFGAGELKELHEIVNAAMPGADPLQFPRAVAGFADQDFRRLGEQYIEQVWRQAPEALHITDKMPSNFFYIGMIHLMFPSAKIIHAMRDPMDSCFSCYSRLFNKHNVRFAYDLGTLGRYYARYIKLMRHWHAVLPPGTILDLHYEDMVADTEGQARRVLEYVGLPWDEACLEFHNNKRRVKTASLAQVRKPIYKTSVARWKHYAKHLGPLLELVSEYRN